MINANNPHSPSSSYIPSPLFFYILQTWTSFSSSFSGVHVIYYRTEKISLFVHISTHMDWRIFFFFFFSIWQLNALVLAIESVGS
uniref:Uncharacterized protein n=1 Tax=Rhizophora mucronata TaxID=61149 RepID=A0A2P2LYK6_RHIMU